MSAKEPFQRPSGAGILLSWATWTLLTPPEVTAPAIPMNPGLHMRGGGTWKCFKRAVETRVLIPQRETPLTGIL